MTEITYLAPGEEKPDFDDDQRWLMIEASDDGRFFGSGASWKPDGEWVGYISLAKDDISIEAAVAAAQRWAVKYEVPTLWVQLTPVPR